MKKISRAETLVAFAILAVALLALLTFGAIVIAVILTAFAIIFLAPFLVGIIGYPASLVLSIAFCVGILASTLIKLKGFQAVRTTDVAHIIGLRLQKTCFFILGGALGFLQLLYVSTSFLNSTLGIVIYEISILAIALAWWFCRKNLEDILTLKG
ncbi:MAG: hypothetical protein ACOX3T_06170 [Bdellovibrionota bacterium]